MKKIRKTGLWAAALLALVVLAGGQLAAREDGDKDLAQRLEIAGKMMKSDGLVKVQDQILGVMNKQITSIMVAKNPKKEKEVRQLMGEILAEMSKTKHDMNDKVAEIYAKHFTLDEMRKLMAFKKTPLGQKMERKMPIIMKESMSIGQKWGQQIAMKIMRRFMEKAKERGLKL